MLTTTATTAFCLLLNATAPFPMLKVSRAALAAPLTLDLLASLADAVAQVAMNTQPIDRMLSLLRARFSPHAAASDAASLAIRRGRGGSTLTHDHATQ